MQSVFADGITNIALTGPVVRIDFGTAVSVINAEGKQDVRLSPNQQVVMPLDGFIRAFSVQEKLMKKLIAEGVVKVQAAPPPSEGSTTLLQ